MEQRIKILKNHPKLLKELANIPVEPHIAATLLGTKPASDLLPGKPDDEEQRLIKLFAKYKNIIKKLKLKFIKDHIGRYILYNPKLCNKILKSLNINKTVEKFIKHRKRHELGYILGYPVQDVRAYIKKRTLIAKLEKNLKTEKAKDKLNDKIMNFKGTEWVTENIIRHDKIILRWNTAHKELSKLCAQLN